MRRPCPTAYGRPRAALLEFAFEAVANLAVNLAGFAPERPMWLRRVVQALWVMLGMALLVVAAAGFVLLAQSLIQPRSRTPAWRRGRNIGRAWRSSRRADRSYTGSGSTDRRCETLP